MHSLIESRNSEEIRNILLFTPKKEEVLTLDEIFHIEKYYYGDKDLLSLYGLSPRQFFQKGVRILGRTAIECTVDIQAKEFAETACKIKQHFFPEKNPIIIDLFLGSGNILYHVAKKLNAITSFGFEKNHFLYQQTIRNFPLVNFKSNTKCGDSLDLIAKFSFNKKDPIVFIIAPPWGKGFNFEEGLDLGKTSPPILEILTILQDQFKNHSIYFFIQIYQKTTTRSVEIIQSSFNFNFQEIVPVMKEGMNTGLLCVHNQ